jgi:lipoprotein-anchoring transpeptidase ErfK/SrfK
MLRQGIAFIMASVLLGGCMRASTSLPDDPNFTALDRRLLANAPYRPVSIPPAYQRTLVEFPRQEMPGSIVVDTDARYLYYVLSDKKAIRYGVAVGEEALSWYGVAKIGRKAEWPSWTPTAEIKRRLGNIPDFVEGGPHNPMGARALYLYAGNKDTLFRIHGTNQPEHIGEAVSSGCIRMTNEDVIELYNRVELGAIVVVLAPRRREQNSPARSNGSQGPITLVAGGPRS